MATPKLTPKQAEEALALLEAEYELDMPWRLTKQGGGSWWAQIGEAMVPLEWLPSWLDGYLSGYKHREPKPKWPIGRKE